MSTNAIEISTTNIFAYLWPRKVLRLHVPLPLDEVRARLEDATEDPAYAGPPPDPPQFWGRVQGNQFHLSIDETRAEFSAVVTLQNAAVGTTCIVRMQNQIPIVVFVFIIAVALLMLVDIANSAAKWHELWFVALLIFLLVPSWVYRFHNDVLRFWGRFFRVFPEAVAEATEYP